MRIRISHATTYRYDTPPTGVTQMLRLTPRNYDGQYIANWRIELSEDCRLHQHEDAFGNVTHSFTADGPFVALRIAVDGEVDTTDTNGVVTGTVERFPPSLFLRETALTEPSETIKEYAASLRAGGGSDLDFLHRLLASLHDEMTFDPDPTHAGTTAAEAYGLKRGVCQDLAHVFIAAARAAGIPARYIGGHFYRADGIVAQQAGHAWAEAYVGGLGWVGFDPANGISPTEAHVRIAIGLDYLGAAPVRGTRYGGSGESMHVDVHVDQAQRQSQS